MVFKLKPERTAVVIGILISIVLLSAAVPLGALARENGELEPNDTRLAATPIEGTQVNGNVERQGGEDWFSVQATGGEKVSFVLTKGPNASGVRISIYSPNGEELVNDTSFDGALRAEVETTASESGTYYLKVNDILGKMPKIPYTVYTPAGEAPPPKDRKTITASEPVQESESNDKRRKANSIPTSKIKGTLSVEGTNSDDEWYSFYAAKGDTVSIVITRPRNHGHWIFIQLFPPSRDEPMDGVKSLKRGDSRHQITFIANRTGKYYINLYANFGSKYRLIKNVKEGKNKSNNTNTTSNDSGTSTDSQTTTNNNDSSTTTENAIDDSNKNTEGQSNRASNAEMSPILMVATGIVIGGTLIGLIVGAVFMIRQQ